MYHTRRARASPVKFQHSAYVRISVVALRATGVKGMKVIRNFPSHPNHPFHPSVRSATSTAWRTMSYP